MSAKNPWASKVYPGAVICDAASRLQCVKASTDADWLERVIRCRDTQKTVRAAARGRLRWVNKACQALLRDYRRQQGEESKP